MDAAGWKKERERTTKFYNGYIEQDQIWFKEVLKKYLEEHPNATIEEAFTAGYVLSEDHPLSRTIHHCVMFTEDNYPVCSLSSKAVMKNLFGLFRARPVVFRNKIEIPHYD